jgi:hypothetical protein
MKYLFVLIFITIGCQSHHSAHQASRDIANNSTFIRTFFKSIEQRSNLTVGKLDDYTRNYLLQDGYDDLLGVKVPNWKRAGLNSEDDVKNIKSFADDADNPNLRRISHFIEREAHLMFPLERKILNEAYEAVISRPKGTYFNHFVEVGSTSNIISVRPNPSAATGLGKSTDFWVSALPQKTRQELIKNSKFYANLGKSSKDPSIIANARRSIEAHADASHIAGFKTFDGGCENITSAKYLGNKADVDEAFRNEVRTRKPANAEEAGDMYKKSLKEEMHLTDTEADRAMCNLAGSGCSIVPKAMGSKFCGR